MVRCKRYCRGIKLYSAFYSACKKADEQGRIDRVLPNYSVTSYESVSGDTKIYVFRAKKKKGIKAYLTDRSKAYIQQKILGCILFALGIIAIPFVGLECIIICLMGLARIIY